MTYEPLDIPLLADDIEGIAFESIQAVEPRWIPKPAAPATQLLVATGLQYAEAAARVQMTDEQLVITEGRLRNLPPYAAVAATCTATIAFADGDPHTAEGGDIIVIRQDGVETLWQVQEDETGTTSVSVVLVSTKAGADYNDVTGTAEMVFPQPSWVSSVTITAPSSGGEDAEDYPTYLDRLAREFPITTGLIIKADQLAAKAVGFPGVGRAVARRVHDPAAPTVETPGHMTVALCDDDGDDVSTPTKDLVEALPTSDDNTIHVVDFDDHTVSINATVIKHDDYPDPDVVKEQCERALEAFFSPLAWGARAEGEAVASTIEATVRLDQVAAVLNNQPGVRYVDFSTVEIKVDGGAFAHADGSLSGYFPLTKPGAMTVTVS